MLDDDLLNRSDRRVRPRDPSVLLDAWAQAYDFGRQDVRRFHTVGRSGRAVLDAVAGKLDEVEAMRWAATGSAAAWLWTGYADFRLTTLYVSEPLREPEALGLRPVQSGDNVWVVVPRDDGVFYGTERRSGVACVHPVQTYLDLLGHPERAKDAATDLRSRLLSWGA